MNIDKYKLRREYDQNEKDFTVEEINNGVVLKWSKNSDVYWCNSEVASNQIPIILNKKIVSGIYSIDGQVEDYVFGDKSILPEVEDKLSGLTEIK